MGSSARVSGHPITIDEWFGMVGKGDLQNFQDSFTADTGISVALVGRAGDALLVPSRDRWFCRFAKTHMPHTCRSELPAVINENIERYEMRVNYEPVVTTCDFGMMEFFAPVYCDDRLIAFWVGGGFTLEGRPRSEELARKFDVTLVTSETLQRHLRRLMATTRLLNISMSGGRLAPSTPRSETVLDGRLTRREREVADLVCHGMSNREVAQALFVSEKTVKSHMTSILSKLGVRDRAQLVFEYNNSRRETGSGK